MDNVWNIPNCELKTILLKKASVKEEIYSALIPELQKFSDYIVKEVRKINELFP